jgi:hypothetical protein
MSKYGLMGLAALGLLCSSVTNAVELKVSSHALERTLKAQLFSGENGRYYIKGDARSACFVYADNPSVSFANDRIVVHVHTSARLGTHIGGSCLGVGLAPKVEVSLVPVAEGETIGFQDARIDRASESRELNFILLPFLSHKVPATLKVNAAEILRQLLAHSTESTGYDLTLDHLKIHSMQVQDNSLVIDVDGSLSVK